MSGPLPQYRTPTRPSDEVRGFRTVIDKVHPGAKGGRPTYTFKEVPVYRHKLVERPADKPSKHAGGRMTAERRSYEAMVARIQKKVAKALAWMQENDKGWDAAVEEGLIPREVVERMSLGVQNG